MPRQRAIPTDFDARLARVVAAQGRPARAGMSRIGPHRGGAGNQSVLTNVPGGDDAAAGAAQLLCLTTASAQIAPGGDYVALDSIVAQYGFDTVVLVPGGVWVHPISGVYVLTYEHVWDSYDGGGTIQLEVDGQVGTERTIASGEAGGRGRGTIAYVAQAGSAARIKVTHDSGSAETCSGTVWVSIPDPTEQAESEGAPPGSATVQLLVDGVLVASASGDVGVSFSTATMLLGVSADDPSASSDYHYDQAEVVRLGSNLISNGGFEAALAGSGTSTAVTTGNWRAYVQGTSTVARVGSPVHTGSQALRINVAGAADQGSFAFQDIAALAPGEVFEVGAMIRPSGAGLQVMGLVFDWDRVAAAPWTAMVEMSSAATSFSAFGLSGSGPALPAGTWSEVVLRVGVVA